MQKKTHFYLVIFFWEVSSVLGALFADVTLCQFNAFANGKLRQKKKGMLLAVDIVYS
jgi:hypothetical protein